MEIFIRLESSLRLGIGTAEPERQSSGLVHSTRALFKIHPLASLESKVQLPVREHEADDQSITAIEIHSSHSPSTPVIVGKYWYYYWYRTIQK
jgi:hypothetical protein